ncbi:hypothetical protein [Caulobacter soli]|uniref:hypothetical protein n=1 Tax=Caulobacter soli TaxID=2708539 RepID=UPI001FED1952|nr:hypothetical protein [Caulobacter soli]
MDQAGTPTKARTSAVGMVLAVGATILVTLGAAVTAGAAPRDPARVAAVFPPWWTSSRAVSAAASVGQIAGAGGAPFILILRGEPGQLEPRARAAGAWLLLDPDAAGQCNPLPPEPR